MYCPLSVNKHREQRCSGIKSMMLWCNWLPLLPFVNEDCGLYSALVCVQISVASTVDSWNLDRVPHTHTMWWCVEVCESVVMVCVCVCGGGGREGRLGSM